MSDSTVEHRERESLERKISMAREMLAKLGADVPCRDIVVAAMEGVIADAETELADGSGHEPTGG